MKIPSNVVFRYNVLSRQVPKVLPKPYLAPQPVNEQVLDADTNCLVTQLSYRDVDPAKEMSKFKFETFTLQNIVAIGAVDKLQYSTIPGSPFDVADTAEAVGAALDFQVPTQSPTPDEQD